MGKQKPVEKTSRSRISVSAENAGYSQVLTDMKQLISDSRHRAAATVNRELVSLYWNIGRVIVEQQEMANWGDSVVEQLANDLRLAFPDMKGFGRDNVFRMRQFFVASREIDAWASASLSTNMLLASALREIESVEKVETLSRQIQPTGSDGSKVATASRPADLTTKVDTPSRQFQFSKIGRLVLSLSWSHHREIIETCRDPAQRYFYMQMSVRERWSVRELRRQIDAALFARYMSAKNNPEACLPEVAEQGDLQPFKDHYVLEFLGLADEHSEKELRKAILGNLREFFLEFGKDLSFIGEEYPLTVGGETFYIDLLFYHRRLQCLVAIDLKKGKFKPMYVGQSQFYVAALDEQVRLPHENPSIALILCRDANHVQVKLSLSVAAKKIGVATYQTALPAEHAIQARLQQLPAFDEAAFEHDESEAT